MNAGSCRPTSAAGSHGPQPVAPVADSVDVVDGELRIVWADGHRSTYGAAEWDEDPHHRRHEARGPPGSGMRGYEIERFDHHQCIADQVTRRDFFEAIRRDGAVVVTGSPTEPGTVIEFLRALGVTLRDSSLGLIFDVKLDPAGYNIAFTAEEVPPHNDNAQYTHPPSGQVLAMLVNDAQGGNSVVVDGWSVLDQLQPRASRGHRCAGPGRGRVPPVLDRSRRVHPGAVGRARPRRSLHAPAILQPADAAAGVRRHRVSPRGTRRTGCSARRSPTLPTTSRSACRPATRCSSTATACCTPARAYQPDGPRHLQDVYFEMDDVFGHLARMSGEATNAMVTDE